MEGSSITPFAWFFMLLSMISVTTLTVYCYYRILWGTGDAQPAPEPDPSPDVDDS